MALCGATSCGCSFQSSSLTVTRNGDAVTLETYEGVATEAPDTRPGAGSRFVGMRVYTTDTKRLFIWETTGWVILSEPPQTWNVTSVTQGVTVACTTTYGRYRRSHGVVEAWIQLTIAGAGTSGQTVQAPTPVTMQNSDSAFGAWTAQSTRLCGGPTLGNGTSNVIFTSDNDSNFFGNGWALASGHTLEYSLSGAIA